MVNLLAKVSLEEQEEEEREKEKKEEEEEEVKDEFRVRTVEQTCIKLLEFSVSFTNETLTRLITETMNFIRYRCASSAILKLR